MGVRLRKSNRDLDNFFGSDRWRGGEPAGSEGVRTRRYQQMGRNRFSSQKRYNKVSPVYARDISAIIVIQILEPECRNKS